MMTDELIADRCQELAALINCHTDGKGDGLHQTDIAPLECVRESVTSTMLHGVSTPMLSDCGSGQKGCSAG